MADRTHTPNYWDYLGLDRLLALQGGLEGDDEALMPDELHFIVTHQAFELWFKLVIRELRLARDHLSAELVDEQHIPHVVHHLRRVSTILRHLVTQFEVMETLTPQDFLAFRDKLVPASGFQSFQMRVIEVLLGMDLATRPRYGKVDPVEHIRDLAKKSPSSAVALGQLERAMAETTLRKAMQQWLFRTPIRGSSPGDPGDADTVASFVDDYLANVAAVHARQAAQMPAALGVDPDAVAARFAGMTAQARAFMHADEIEDAGERARVRRIRAALVFIESYRTLPLLAWPRLLLDTIVETEEQLVLFRTRHARMVERVIGRRIGTGGSSGVDYLDQTTGVRVFHDLWTVRTLLLPRRELPALDQADYYAFAGKGSPA
ncbi:MAG: tryptophan 2,3-dioxygenase [Alphaproteobacteria bacterium]|nr:tryptophan 2,3-dioxygenase [Alphaproteobacteria bacterium]